MKIFDAGGISNEEIINQFHAEREITFRTFTLSDKELNFLINVLEICLEDIGKEYIFDYFH